ncbi:MAG TPA: hypothetical protein PKD28_02960 [Candidatus Saccharibacteria bacterium]|nr:hypothetical protein [Candidatus Saccharibacteria bacterium]
MTVSYETPRITNLRKAGTDANGVALYGVTFATFTEDASRCYPLLGQVLRGLERLATRSDNPVSAGRIARVEFIWDRATNQRGAVFFDDRGVPLLHVINALLGYQGAGSALSHRIMRDLGLSESVFTEINTLVNNQDYVVVLTREPHVEKDGVMHALPMMVTDTWDWRRYVPED